VSSDVVFAVIEQKEPHAGRMAFADVAQPRMFAERVALARRIRDELEVTLPIWVDGMDDASRALFSDLPSPAFLIDRSGRIADKLPWADAAPLEAALVTLLARECAPAARASGSDRLAAMRRLSLLRTLLTLCGLGACATPLTVPTAALPESIRPAGAHAHSDEPVVTLSLVSPSGDGGATDWCVEVIAEGEAPEGVSRHARTDGERGWSAGLQERLRAFAVRGNEHTETGVVRMYESRVRIRAPATVPFELVKRVFEAVASGRLYRIEFAARTAAGAELSLDVPLRVAPVSWGPAPWPPTLRVTLRADPIAGSAVVRILERQLSDWILPESGDSSTVSEPEVAPLYSDSARTRDEDEALSRVVRGWLAEIPPHRERQVVLLNTVDVDLQTVVRAIDLLRSAGVEQIDFVVVPATK